MVLSKREKIISLLNWVAIVVSILISLFFLAILVQFLGFEEQPLRQFWWKAPVMLVALFASTYLLMLRPFPKLAFLTAPKFAKVMRAVLVLFFTAIGILFLKDSFYTHKTVGAFLGRAVPVVAIVLFLPSAMHLRSIFHPKIPREEV